MSALVVYESLFGNTAAIATAIAEGLSRFTAVDVAHIGAAPATIGTGVELLVAGGPTHAFSMTRARTRADAATQGGQRAEAAGPGLREWLDGVQAESAGIPAAAFGTVIDKPWVPGSAARAAEKRLQRIGFRIVAPAESFAVTGVAGPLADGELDRARQWGAALGAGLRTPDPVQ